MRTERLYVKAQNGWKNCSPSGGKECVGEHCRFERPTAP